MKTLRCPKCGKKAFSIKTRYGIRNYHCDVWSWGEAPLVDKKTHEARKEAHLHFDPLWQEGFIGRSQAYITLAKILRIPRNQCHMKTMDYETASRVPSAVKYMKWLYK